MPVYEFTEICSVILPGGGTARVTISSPEPIAKDSLPTEKTIQNAALRAMDIAMGLRGGTK